jgi:hypothetical protein
MKSSKAIPLSALAALAMLGVPAAAHATTVATIDGCYDCAVYDTPTLTFHNTSGGTLINAMITLTPYQPGTLDFSVAPQTRSLGTLAAGDTVFNWTDGQPSVVKGDLFSYDFDDSYGNSPPGYTNPNCVIGGALCSLVGNFSVTFTATISGGTFNGDPVFSVFSPATNQTGHFIGWEGLDPTGLSETVFDQHSGSTSTVNGTLANIDIGTPPTTVPEPGTLSLLGIGAFGLVRRFRKTR